MYHISPTTGNPNQCGAKPGNCPFGADAEHFETKDEARAAFEEKQANPIPTATSKPSSPAVEVDPEQPDELWARMGGRRIFKAEVAELLTAPGEDNWSVARLEDGSFINRHGLDPLHNRGKLGNTAEAFRRDLIEKASKRKPLLRVVNGDFPLDEARDYLANDPNASVKKAAEAAFSSTFSMADPELKERVYEAAEERGGEVKGAILNEYTDYADLVETVREPTDPVSVNEPRTTEGKAVADSKNPLSQAFYTFRGKSDIDPVIARDVLEQTFPVSVTGLSKEAQDKVFSIARDRADNWGSFVEEYRTAADIASLAKDAPKRWSVARLPRNTREIVSKIDTKAKAEEFIKESERYVAGRGENVRATVSELTDELRYDERFTDLF